MTRRIDVKARQPPLRVGHIGCGGMSVNFHLPGIRRVPDLKLVALSDLDEERLRTAAAGFGVEGTFADYERMLDQCDLDVVGIVGPPMLHVRAGIACLKRQIPFMTEKPLATTVGQAREIARIAAEYGDCGQVAYTSRASPSQRLAWRISRLPEFGAITYVYTSHLTHSRMRPCWDKTESADGFVHLHGVHAIDLWRFFAGDPAEVAASLSGFKVHPDGHGALGSIHAYVRAANGPSGTIHMKAGNPHNADVNSDVMGETGRVRVENNQTVVYELEKGWIRQVMAGDVLADQINDDQPYGMFLGTGLTQYSYYPDFFRFEWLALARRLLRGEPLSPSITDVCRTVCLAEAICQSLREGGRLVPVNYDLLQGSRQGNGGDG